jgi:prephenate dehydrogenase
MRIKTLTIIGVGLIGGSVGLAAKRRGVADRVVGVGRRWDSLERAQTRGAIDEATQDLATAVAQSEASIFCTPVNLIAQQVLSSASACQPGALITDAGSTKAEIVRTVETNLPRTVLFVGSHPLAGSEKSGPEHADADLFCDRLVIVTPTERTLPEASARVTEFWQALGARVERMAPAEHDQALAWTSHLPHLLAAALSNTLPQELKRLAASGFRDTARLASGAPDLWTAIFAQNRAAVLRALDALEDQLSRLRSALSAQSCQPLYDLLVHAKRARDDLGS